MVICHCNIITGSDIEAAVRGFLDQDPWQVVTPLKVYHALGKRGRCCGCFPNAIALIVRTVEAWHREQATPEAEVMSLLDRLRSEHERVEAMRKAARAARHAA